MEVFEATAKIPKTSIFIGKIALKALLNRRRY